MTIALGSVDSVRRIIGMSAEQVPDATINQVLQESDRLIRAQHYQSYMCDLFYASSIRLSGNTNLVYELYFPIKANSSIKIYVNGVLTTAYTQSGSILTFTAAQNLVFGDKVMVFYTPEFFDDYANWLTAESLYATAIVDTSNGVMLQNQQHIKDRVMFYRKLIAGKPHIAAAVDHAETSNLW